MRTGRHIQWKELIFFMGYFLVFPILTDLQYINQWHMAGHFGESCVFRVVEGVLNFFPYYVYYAFLIPRFLFPGKYLRFLGALGIWLLLNGVYALFVQEWAVSKMTFLPAQAREWAYNGFHGDIWLHQAFTLVLTNLTVITALAYFLRSAEQERQVGRLKRQQLQLELEYLKAQMNPHFLFNTLNNIYSLAQEQSQQTAPLVARLSELMRYVLYDSGADKVPLSREVGFIENYMDIERVRYPGRIDVRFDWQGEAEGMMIEPLLLIPFVENAFKHGIREELARGFVEVVTLLADGELTLEVRNSKPGEDRAAPPPGGLGLRNVRKRLDLLYPGRHHLRVVDDPGTYTVSLTLQLA